MNVVYVDVLLLELELAKLAQRTGNELLMLTNEGPFYAISYLLCEFFVIAEQLTFFIELHNSHP